MFVIATKLNNNNKKTIKKHGWEYSQELKNYQ